MASFSVIFKLAIATLWESKLRSILTLIGMVFGTAAVIATLSSNEGAQRYIAKQLEGLGNKLMIVNMRERPMSVGDIPVLDRFADEIDSSVVESNLGEANIRFQSKSGQGTIIASNNDYFKAMNLDIATGRQFLKVELSEVSPVVILGHKIRVNLFGNNSLVNDSIMVKLGSTSLMARVIGAFREKGGAAGVALDNGIFISTKLGHKLATQNNNSRLILILKDDNRASIAKRQVMALLGPKYGDNMQISDSRESIERTQSIWAKQNFVGICLAAISLLTGGVGIMNIMLLSIHQRRKEIGLRKAVGAQNSEIAMQFLLEAVLICLLGGLGGVVVGCLFGQQVAKMLGDWDAVTSPQNIMMALTFAVLTGIIFGLLPALRASRIDPYDALRTG